MLTVKTAAEVAQADFALGQLLAEPNGFQKVAAENLPPFIRETRDYQAFGRKLLKVHNVTRESLHMINDEPYFYYSKDLNSHAAYYGDDGEIARLQIEGTGVNVGIATISSDDTTIHLKRLLTQRYAYLDRVRELSGQAMAKAEDIKILDLIERLLLGSSTDVKVPSHASQVRTTADTMLLKSHLVELKKCLSQHDLEASTFLMNQVVFDDMLVWAQNEIDQLTQREMLETGAKTSIWGMKIITSRVVRKNTVYIFSTPDFVGRMPILQDLTVTMTETKNKLEKGIFMFEFIGLYLASHLAIGKLILGYKENDPMIQFYGDVDRLGVQAIEEEQKAVGYGSLEGK